MGEMLELGEQSRQLHLELGAEVAATGMDLLVTVGAGAMPIAEAARQGGMAADAVVTAPDLFAAAEYLTAELRQGDCLLCKASRRIGLERLLELLAARLDARSAGTAGAAAAVS